MQARGRDVHDRVDLRVVDHFIAVVGSELDLAQDLDDMLDRVHIDVGGGYDLHQTVVGEKSQRRRVGPGDRPASDQPEPERLRHCFAAKLGAASDGPCNASIGSWRSP
jgi:hypothetical protein